MAKTNDLVREIAFDTFIDVMEHHKRPDEVLENYYQHYPQLDKRDRGFIKELLYGSLRWYGKIYWILQQTSKRDLKTSSSQIRVALIMGTYQIFYMEKVPDRAAVNESVEYIRRKGQASACSFVNGILRQIARRAEYFQKPDKTKHPGQYLEIQYSHPRWICERWLNQFNFDQVESMVAANNKPPPCTVRINALKVELENIKDFQDHLLKLEKTGSNRRPLRCAMHLESSPSRDQKSLFSQGFFTMQDEASQLIGYLVGPKDGENILDICAGPGGKLSHIYELCSGNANLIAIEKNPIQFAKMQSTMSRLQHHNYKAIETDFLAWKSDIQFDRILIDAPCSGLGVLKRHPEGKWLKPPSIIIEKAGLQRQLIEKALLLLKPQGELIYAVCSHEPEESLDHLQWLDSTYKDKFSVISPIVKLPDYYKKYVTRNNLLYVYSGNSDDMDGFAAFIIRRTT